VEKLPIRDVQLRTAQAEARSEPCIGYNTTHTRLWGLDNDNSLIASAEYDNFMQHIMCCATAQGYDANTTLMRKGAAHSNISRSHEDHDQDHAVFSRSDGKPSSRTVPCMQALGICKHFGKLSGGKYMPLYTADIWAFTNLSFNLGHMDR